MKLLLPNPNIMALWRGIIHEAESICAISLKEELESYLVFLLTRFTNKPELVKQIMASEFLHSMSLGPHQRAFALQEIGDKCLIFSGLFPKIAEKRHVKIGYFVQMGSSAYSVISKTGNDVYDLLAHQFIPMMDVLQSIRCYSNEFPDLMPLEAYELWNQTGSHRALKILRTYTQATPVRF